MNEKAQDAWFYTVEGERLGPLTFAELRDKAGKGELNPRLDMVWTQGMAEWKASGEVDGLFEKRITPEPENVAVPAVDPSRMMEEGGVEEMMSREADWPGARRRSFYVMTILFPTLWMVGCMVAAGFVAELAGPQLFPLAMLAAVLVPVILALHFSLERLVNVGMSRWWFLGNLVPVLSFWVAYRMYVCPAGYAYHKKLDGAGVALAILYWLMVALSLLSLVVVVAAMVGMIDNPELQEEIRKLMESMPHEANRP